MNPIRRQPNEDADSGMAQKLADRARSADCRRFESVSGRPSRMQMLTAHGVENPQPFERKGDSDGCNRIQSLRNAQRNG